MILALVKNGVVVNRVAVQDGVTVVPLQSQNDAKMYDLYDGRSFTPNPDSARLISQELKKRQIVSEIQSVDSDALSRKLKDLSDANPVPQS